MCNRFFAELLQRTPSVLFFLVWLCALPGSALAGPWPELDWDGERSDAGRLDAAIVVGIEDYAFVQDVPGATRNADDWFSFLVHSRGVPPTNVLLLRDAEATRESIFSAAKEASEIVGAGGTLWFVFIGHGAPSSDGRDGLMLGVDVQQTATSVYARGVSRVELLTGLERGRQERTVAVLDACFSGSNRDGSALVPGLQPLIPAYASDAIGNSLVLTAAQSDQFAGPLPGADRPAFTYLLLGALRGWADNDQDEEVTVGEALRYAQGALRLVVNDRTQRPQLIGGGEDVVLSFGSEEGPDLADMALRKEARLGVSPRRSTAAETNRGARRASGDSARPERDPPGSSLGVTLDLGGATSVGGVELARHMRFAWGLGGSYELRLNEKVGLMAGLGVMDKGFRTLDDPMIDENLVALTNGYEIRLDAAYKFLYLHVPIGLNARLGRATIHVSLPLSYALRGEIERSNGNEDLLGGSDWSDYRRFNLGPCLGAGYALSLGSVDLVPGLTWTMHLGNEVYNEPGHTNHYMNLMLTTQVVFDLS